MIYLLYSLTQKSFLKREANKIVKSSLETPDEFNYAKVDAKETTVQEIVDICLEVPFLNNKKVVVVDDAFFIASTKSKEKINSENDYDKLIKYLANPCEETDLVFLVYADKLDTRTKIYKVLEKVAKISSFEPLKENDWEKYILQILNKRNVTIEYNANKELAKRTLNDRDRLLNELEKLTLYTNDIKLNDVITLVNVPLEEKAFELSNALLKGDISGALFVYNSLVSKNVEPVTMLNMLANQFRLIYIANYLNKLGNDYKAIAKQLNMNEFRIKMALASARRLKDKLVTLLDDLYEVDYKIKSSQVDRFYAFELFIINFKRNYFKEL